MKKLFSMLVLAALLTSCSKTKDDIAAIPSKKLAQIKMDFGDNTDYTYDEKGRIVKIVSGNQETISEYGNNTVTQSTRSVSLNFVSSKIIHSLDAKGRASSGTGFFQMSPADTKHDIQLTETYDAAGFLTQIEIKMDNNQKSVYEYYWLDGNVTEVKIFYNNQFDSKSKYYYPNKVPNKIQSGIGDGQNILGAAILGNINQHLPEKTEHYNKTGVLTSTVNHQYELDGEGYPAKRIVTGTGGNNIHFFIYKN